MVEQNAAHQQSCSSSAATALRRRGNDLGATIKYLRKTTSGAAGIGLGTTVKYLRAAAAIGGGPSEGRYSIGVTAMFLNIRSGFRGSTSLSWSACTTRYKPAPLPWVYHPESTKSSQVNTLPKAKSKTRSKQNINMHKFRSVYSEWGVPFPVLTSGGE